MKLISKGFAGNYWEPPEPALYEDDYGNEVCEGDEMVKFPDGDCYGVDGLYFLGEWWKFAYEYSEQLQIELVKARHNSLIDEYGRKIRKGDKYFIIDGKNYGYKSITLDGEELIDGLLYHYEFSVADEEEDAFWAYVDYLYDCHRDEAWEGGD